MLRCTKTAARTPATLMRQPQPARFLAVAARVCVGHGGVCESNMHTTSHTLTATSRFNADPKSILYYRGSGVCVIGACACPNRLCATPYLIYYPISLTKQPYNSKKWCTVANTCLSKTTFSITTFSLCAHTAL